ncbi:MAG TPA: hypothetical protein VFA51_14985 [Candidatus Udaeobacter sp.]|nr:hypothetical protein [Candidatus Udaeobacter sp.]
MVNQDKITSGFDVEFLMGEEYIKYFLLSSMETGSIPWFSETEVKDAQGNHVRTDASATHPPDELNQKRLYPVHPEFLGHENPFLDLGVPAYSAQEDEFTVTLLRESPVGADIRLKLYPTIINNLDHPDQRRILSNILSVNLDLKFEVVSSVGSDGLLSNIGLKIELLDINGPLIDTAESLPPDEDGNPVFSKADTLASMKQQVDRTVDFSVAGGGKIAAIALKKFFADDETPNAIGIYINLVLQNGPRSTDLLPDRGNADNAQNFLPVGSRMAFGFAPETYQRLGEDLFQKMAVLKEGTTDEFEYPLIQDGEKKGKIKSITVRPEIRIPPGPGGNPTFTNVLVIDVHGEYAIENFFDPDFHFLIRLVPIQKNGLLDFDLDFDLQLSALGQIIVFFLETVITVLLPKLGLSLLFATLLIIKVIEKVGEDAAAGVIQSELDKTSFLDTLPNKLTVEKRRWDPLYFTTHRIEAAVDDLVVNNSGFAFSANDLFIGKKFEPLADMVIRAATRDETGAVNGLLYRAKDLQPFLQTDLKFIFPAVDRMPFIEIIGPDGGIESFRVSLALDQITDRLSSEDKGAKDKHLEKIQYVPKKVHVIKHQIYKLLAVSLTEIAETEQITRNLLRSEIRAQKGAAFRQEAIDELQQELGRPPTDEEITARVNFKLDQAVAIAFPARLKKELEKRMRFELEPFEFADLQKNKVMTLGLGKLDIITMHRDGRVTVYYRDHEQPFEPHVDPSDNLLNLPKYTSL